MANSNEVKSDGKAAAAAGSGGGSSGASVPVSASVVVGTDKDAAGKTRPMPKDAQVMVAILKDMGITDYEPRVVNQMLEFSYRYVTNVLDDAKVMSAHARKKAVDVDDVKLAVQMYSEQNMTSPPSRDVLLDFARAKNSAPLPVPRSTCGLRLPPDRHCLTACNYRLRQKRGPRPAPGAGGGMKAAGAGVSSPKFLGYPPTGGGTPVQMSAATTPQFFMKQAPQMADNKSGIKLNSTGAVPKFQIGPAAPSAAAGPGVMGGGNPSAGAAPMFKISVNPQALQATPGATAAGMKRKADEMTDGSIY